MAGFFRFNANPQFKDYYNYVHPIGWFFANKQVDFLRVFKIVVISEYVFVFQLFVKIVWFGIFNTYYDLIDVQSFAPLSFINLFDRTTLEPWLVYPLSLVNLFEVAYIITLSYLLAKILEWSFMESLKLVVLSYGTGLLIWVVFITFLTVSLSP